MEMQISIIIDSQIDSQEDIARILAAMPGTSKVADVFPDAVKNSAPKSLSKRLIEAPETLAEWALKNKAEKKKVKEYKQQVKEADAYVAKIEALANRPAKMPTFATDEAKREWLVDQLTGKGEGIPPRTRTITLEKKWLELQAGSKEPDSTPDPVKHSQAQVEKTLRAYIEAAADDKEKSKRRNSIKAELNVYGATNTGELKEEYYATIINAYRSKANA